MNFKLLAITLIFDRTDSYGPLELNSFIRHPRIYNGAVGTNSKRCVWIMLTIEKACHTFVTLCITTWHTTLWLRFVYSNQGIFSSSTSSRSSKILQFHRQFLSKKRTILVEHLKAVNIIHTLFIRFFLNIQVSWKQFPILFKSCLKYELFLFP